MLVVVVGEVGEVGELHFVAGWESEGEDDGRG